MPILGFFAAWNCAKLPFYWVPWTEEESVAVSYTHLTLPTKLEV